MRELSMVVPGRPVLVGTLTLPDSGHPAPCVLIASGSGPLDRDSNHRRARFDVARQLSHALVAGLSDNVDDLGRALIALAARPEVDPDRVLLAGHSEGAILAAALAARVGRDVAGVILLSMSGRPGDELLRWQARRIGPTLPAPVRALLRLLRVDLERKVAANHERIRATTTDVARIGGARLNARWHREFLDHDPREDLGRIAVPVLAVTGDKDLQVDPADLAVIAATVPGGATVHRVPDLTHTLRRQPGPSALSRYREELRRPVDAGVLAMVVAWSRQASGVGSPGR
jgi:uncharacterized protein